MIELIKNLLRKWGCMHEWEFYKERTVVTEFGGRYFLHTFICKKCGKFKQKNI